MLAIYTPSLGTPSETFIRKHIEHIAPGQSVVICDAISDHFSNWRCSKLPIYRTTSFLNWNIKRLSQALSCWPLPRNIDPLDRFLRRHKVRVVLGEFMNHFLPVYRQLRSAGVNCYVHAHGYDVSAALRNPKMVSMYKSYADSAGIITMSKFSKRALVALGLPPDKIHVIPYGVDIPRNELIRPTTSSLTRCIAVGRMTPKKAPLLLLDAFKAALANGVNLELEYIGSGDLFHMAADFVRMHRLEKAVTLHGARDSAFVAERLKHADLFIQHSVTDSVTGDMEGLPVAILEAMGSGLPVVSTRHAGIPEQVVEDETGLLVDEGDVHGMAQSIVRLARNPELCRRMGRAARHRALQKFSWENNRNQLRAVMGLA
jgi:colanic acid/amylovoran biosynthesis glycosyltransferase